MKDKTAENLTKTSGERLRELRKKENMTQEALAEFLDCSVQQISYIERGKRPLSDRLARKLARRFRVSLAYLLGESDYATSLDLYDSLRDEYMTRQDMAEDILSIWFEMNGYTHVRTAFAARELLQVETVGYIQHFIRYADGAPCVRTLKELCYEDSLQYVKDGYDFHHYEFYKDKPGDPDQTICLTEKDIDFLSAEIVDYIGNRVKWQSRFNGFNLNSEHDSKSGKDYLVMDTETASMTPRYVPPMERDLGREYNEQNRKTDQRLIRRMTR